jgi:8-oxo-dGTP pyrophosphatase MutT (NUDIX family)
MKKHLETNVGVYAFILKDKKLFMLHKPNDPIWCALGGRMDSDETDPIMTLHREAKEEIGVNIKVHDIFDSKLWSINGKKHRLGLFYVCSFENDNEEIILSEEHDKFTYFSFNEAIEMLSLEERGQVGIELIRKLHKKELIE